MAHDRLFKIGLTGTIVTAICCFTPLLPFLLGAAGLSLLTGYLDIVLLPLLVVFAGMTIFAFWKRRAV